MEHLLEEVNRELRGSSLVDPTAPLPEYAGGGPVGLLVWIQDIRLDPILLGTIPSEIRVYQCPFVDVWGSSLAFARLYMSFQPSAVEFHSSSLLLQLQKFLVVLRSPGADIESLAETRVCVFPP